MRSHHSRLFAVLAVLLVLAGAATPVAAEEDSDAGPIPAEEPETIRTGEVTVHKENGEVELSIGIESSIQGEEGVIVTSSENGPVYACYFMHTSERSTDFYADTSSRELEVGQNYWRLCYKPGTNVITDDFIALWTDDGWLRGGVGEQLLMDQATNQLQTHLIEITLSPTDVQITGLETWMQTTSEIKIDEVVVALDGSSVAARATLLWVEIDPGDGSDPFKCRPEFFDDSHPSFDGSGCHHTYLEVPEHGSAYTMSTTTIWNVEQRGFFSSFGGATPITFEEDIVVEVRDLEALIAR